MNRKPHNKIFDIFEQAIVKVTNYSTGEIYSAKEHKFTIIEEQNVSNKYSATPAIHLYVDGERLKFAKNFKITFLCRCGRLNEIHFVKYVEKIRSGIFRCKHCLQDSNYDCIVANPYGMDGKKNHKDEYVKKSTSKVYVFNNESDEFKAYYAGRPGVLTEDEFKHYLTYAIKLYNIELTDDIRDKIRFIYAYPSTNGLRYVQRAEYNGEIHPIDLYFKCDICGHLYKPHIDNLKKGLTNVNSPMCRFCRLTNRSYPILKYKDTGITYQSKLELKFLDLCMKSGIKVENGPEVPYYWNDANRKYLIDFFLPETISLVEIKANHIYHQKQVKNGKWGAKEEAGRKYAKRINGSFNLLFDKDIEDFIERTKR